MLYCTYCCACHVGPRWGLGNTSGRLDTKQASCRVTNCLPTHFLSLTPQLFIYTAGINVLFWAVIWFSQCVIGHFTHSLCVHSDAISSAVAERDWRSAVPDEEELKNKPHTRFSSFFHAASVPVARFVVFFFFFLSFCMTVTNQISASDFMQLGQEFSVLLQELNSRTDWIKKLPYVWKLRNDTVWCQKWKEDLREHKGSTSFEDECEMIVWYKYACVLSLQKCLLPTLSSRESAG